MGKKFQELDLSNAFLFAAALEDKETCSLVLEALLGKKISVVSVHGEYTLLFSSDFKCVRLDVYAKDELEVSYDLEMQNTDTGNLAKRSRFYQAELDVSSLKPGENYQQLKPSYIIFICTFDPFGKGLYRYVFEEYCKEAELPLGDGTQKIFLNTKGMINNGESEELIQFLRYVENSTEDVAENSPDGLVNRIHARVQSLKSSRELEANYMYFEELLQEREEQGRREGLNGMAESLLDILSVKGTVSEPLREKVMSEKSIETLKKWIVLAAKSDSVEEFESQM